MNDEIMERLNIAEKFRQKRTEIGGKRKVLYYFIKGEHT